MPEDIADLRWRALDARLASQRVVVLGETNHFVHEKAAFRLWWLKRLASMRRLVLAEELSWLDGRCVATYLSTGDPAHINRAATFGGVSPVSRTRPARPSGVLGASWDRFPTDAFRAEQQAFYAAVRLLAPDARFVGIDIGLVDAAYPPLLEYIARHAPRPIAQQLLSELTPRPDDSFTVEAERLRAAAARVSAVQSSVAEIWMQHVQHELDNMRACLEYAASAWPAPDYAALAPAMALREAFMKRQVATLLAGLADDEVLVLMGHAFHLARNDQTIGWVGAGPGGRLEPSLGHWLAASGVPFFAVWMLYGSGRDSQPFPDLPQVANFPDHALNCGLQTAGVPMVLGLSEADHAPPGELSIGHLYNQVVPTCLSAQADAVFFLPEVSPLRLTDASTP